MRKLFSELGFADRGTKYKRRSKERERERAIGTIEVDLFNVPNPGGGQDLINDCSVTFCAW